MVATNQSVKSSSNTVQHSPQESTSKFDPKGSVLQIKEFDQETRKRVKDRVY